MVLKRGIHFYLNITNLNDIVEDEEKRTNSVNHSIHALNTYFTAVERYSRSLGQQNLFVEKITGSRLHMYLVEGPGANADTLLKKIWQIAVYSVNLKQFIKEKIGKYNTLKEFDIQLGACEGIFYEYNFKRDNVDETTTIGYAANLAAKIQALASNNSLAISNNLFNLIITENIKKQFISKQTTELLKYGQKYYYEIKLLSDRNKFSQKIYTDVIAMANDINLGDIEFSTVRGKLKFDNLSITQCKKTRGIVVFADVRGFTQKFAANGSNLNVMGSKTISILNKMYDLVKEHEGTHIQFQGDREFAFFNTDNETNTIRNAILYSMHLLDNVDEALSIQIGSGENLGDIYATKVGIRGCKDNVLLGKTVNTADMYEDKYAGENQIVISKDMYNNLSESDNLLKKQFKYNIYGDCYITTVNYKTYYNLWEEDNSRRIRQSNSYNGAWLSDSKFR